MFVIDESKKHIFRACRKTQDGKIEKILEHKVIFPPGSLDWRNKVRTFFSITRGAEGAFKGCRFAVCHEAPNGQKAWFNYNGVQVDEGDAFS